MDNKVKNNIFCSFCTDEYSKEELEYLDSSQEGFWCDSCDGFTYFTQSSNSHKFTLILEDRSSKETITNKSNIKFSKRLSPYRYPGGKSKIIDYLHTHLEESKSNTLASPFTGGGSFELAMLEAGVVDELIINDLDIGVYALWNLIINEPEYIIKRLFKKLPTHEDYFAAQSIIKSNYKDVSSNEAGWASLLVNRLAYSGISKANPLGGKSGTQKNLLSRWNPDNLAKRIMKINELKDQIVVKSMDACEFIEEYYWLNKATVFIDPPYVNKGKDLYHCYYKEEDHINLSWLLDSLYRGCPGADIVVTYDYSEWLENLYEHPEIMKIGRVYSA
ncbi:DNA adenine methylase [Bacillus sp. Marseille-P3800]|uniref:DNA adenine methylase n=1 Tax=Bacillus sp. Marseille-P3800 TaxID=2014782 RepID=UPI000C08029D|nr:DNA adenine methylase [Bacillus sp. Marseille-P3800]